jgi:translation elongation factor P/translation initiation factor 5A
MGTIKAGGIDKGMFLEGKGDPYAVVEREFVNPGKGSSFVRLKLKNLKTGAVLKVLTRLRIQWKRLIWMMYPPSISMPMERVFTL